MGFRVFYSNGDNSGVYLTDQEDGTVTLVHENGTTILELSEKGITLFAGCGISGLAVDKDGYVKVSKCK